MTTVNSKKEIEKEKEEPNENLFFHLNDDLAVTNDELERLKEILENTEVNDKTKKAFRNAHKFYEKFKQNNFSISLEEIAREFKP